VASTVHGGCFLQNWIKAGTVSSSSKVPFITAGIGKFTFPSHPLCSGAMDCNATHYP
jgi:hypothetical protein